MKRNIDGTGRLWRGALGLFILLYAWKQASWAALLLGLFVLYEALASWCVVYQILGKNSCPIDKDDSSLPK